MSFKWDPKTQARIEKARRKENIQTAVLGTLLILGILTVVVAIRWAIVGFEYNECFWAQDVGTCLALRNK